MILKSYFDQIQNRQVNVAIISAVWNEKQFIKGLFRSVSSLKPNPTKWIIVDDGSTDSTSIIVDKYKKKNSWVDVVFQPKKTCETMLESYGKAIRMGILKILESEVTFDLLGIVDADVLLPPDYYATIWSLIKQNHKVVAASGVVFSLVDGKYVLEPTCAPRGCCLTITRDFLREIDVNDIPNFAPDTYFLLKAMLQGYKIKVFPELRVFQRRMTHSRSFKSRKYGAGYYSFGCHLILVAIYSFLLLRKGYATEMLRGYFEAKEMNLNRTSDPGIRYFYGLRGTMLRNSIGRLVGRERIYRRIGILGSSQSKIAES